MKLEYDIGKVIVLLGMVAGGIVALVQHEATIGTGLLFSAGGYVFGNGRLIIKGEEPRPAVRAKPVEPPEKV